MAKIEITGLDEMRAKLEARGAKVGGTINHMLNAGAKIVREEMQSAMKEYELKDTGDMMKSVKSSKIMPSEGGGKCIAISPQGIDRKGVPNAAKAIVYESGTSRNPARPWKTLADERARDRVIERMAEIFNEEMSNAESGGGDE